MVTNNDYSSILSKHKKLLEYYNDMTVIKNNYNTAKKSITEEINKTYDINNCKILLITAFKQSYKLAYLNTIKNIESYYNNNFQIDYNSKIEEIKNIDIKKNKQRAQYFVKSLNKKIYYLEEMLLNKQTISNFFLYVNNSLDTKLKNISIKYLNNQKILTNINYNNTIFWSIYNKNDFVNLQNDKFITKIKVPENVNTTYRVYVSEQNFDSSFVCKLKINYIYNNSYLDNNWYYCFGLIKSVNKYKARDYYNHACSIQSNTKYNNQFTGSLSNKNYGKRWQVGDVIKIERNKNFEVYYSINDNYLQKVFENIDSTVSIMLALDQICIKDEFELVD